MKKHFYYTAGFVLFVSFSTFAQSTSVSDAISAKAENNYARPLKFEPINPANDKTDQVEITGLGAATFTTSNIADGSLNSYKHSQKISISLNPLVGKTGSYQLIFYPESDHIQYAASSDNGVVSIYYPLNLFTVIKGTLEQSFAAKKKVTVKVIQKADGYREGTLVF